MANYGGNENLTKWVWRRRLRTARKVRTILFGPRLRPGELGTPGTSRLSSGRAWNEMDEQAEDCAEWTWACILGHFVNAGRITYREVYRVAERLAPRLAQYPDKNTKWSDRPYRELFRDEIIAYLDSLGPAERGRRRSHFLDTLDAGRRRALAREALALHRCPACFDRLPCTTHGIGEVVFKNGKFEEVSRA